MISAEATRRSRNYAPNDQKDWHKAHRSAFCRQNHAKASGQACCYEDLDVRGGRPLGGPPPDGPRTAPSAASLTRTVSAQLKALEKRLGDIEKKLDAAVGRAPVRRCSSRTQTRAAHHDAPSYHLARNPGGG